MKAGAEYEAAKQKNSCAQAAIYNKNRVNTKPGRTRAEVVQRANERSTSDFFDISRLEDSLIAGYLFERPSQGIVRKWRKRFLFIQQTTLYSFESENAEKETRSEVDLSKAQLEQGHPSMENSFSIVTGDTKIELAAESKETKAEWIEVFFNILQQPANARKSSMVYTDNDAFKSLKLAKPNPSASDAAQELERWLLYNAEIGKEDVVTYISMTKSFGVELDSLKLLTVDQMIKNLGFKYIHAKKIHELLHESGEDAVSNLMAERASSGQPDYRSAVKPVGGGKFVPTAGGSGDTLSLDEVRDLFKYRKYKIMLKSRIPEQAIRQRMTMDRMKTLDIDIFFGDAPMPSEAAKGFAGGLVKEEHEQDGLSSAAREAAMLAEGGNSGMAKFGVGNQGGAGLFAAIESGVQLKQVWQRNTADPMQSAQKNLLDEIKSTKRVANYGLKSRSEMQIKAAERQKREDKKNNQAQFGSHLLRQTSRIDADGKVLGVDVDADPHTHTNISPRAKKITANELQFGAHMLKKTGNGSNVDTRPTGSSKSKVSAADLSFGATKLRKTGKREEGNADRLPPTNATKKIDADELKFGAHMLKKTGPGVSTRPDSDSSKVLANDLSFGATKLRKTGAGEGALWATFL